MAVQQNKKSHSRKGMRRAHDAISTPNVVYCTCGAPMLSHAACPDCGKYHGRQVVVKKEKVEAEN